MAWRVLLLVIFIGALVGSTTVYCGGCSPSGQVTGPAGFHVACFAADGRAYINTLGTSWKGAIDGVFTVTMDNGLKASVHGERCLIEEVSATQWAEAHRTTPPPAPVPTPAPSPTPPAVDLVKPSPPPAKK